MPTFKARLPVITVAAAATISNILLGRDIDDAIYIWIFSPTVLDAGTWTIEVTDSDCTDPLVNPPGALWRTMQLGDTSPADAAPPAAARARAYLVPPGVGGLRIRCSVGVAANRDFAVTKVYSTY